MVAMPDLKRALLDLLHEIEDTDITLIIGGGFGIYLKIEHVQRLGTKTLLKEWPEPRSTNDLDLFLRAELVIESAKLKPLPLRIGLTILIRNLAVIMPWIYTRFSQRPWKKNGAMPLYLEITIVPTLMLLKPVLWSLNIFPLGTGSV